MEGLSASLVTMWCVELRVGEGQGGSGGEWAMDTTQAWTADSRCGQGAGCWGGEEELFAHEFRMKRWLPVGMDLEVTWAGERVGQRGRP